MCFNAMCIILHFQNDSSHRNPLNPYFQEECKVMLLRTYFCTSYGELCSWARLVVNASLRTAKSAFSNSSFIFPEVSSDTSHAKSPSDAPLTHYVQSSYTCIYLICKWFSWARFFAGFSGKGWSALGRSLVAAVEIISLWNKTGLGLRHDFTSCEKLSQLLHLYVPRFPHL